ncbi:hypothetical protein LPTSP4_09670 [Leptospira ryugenii]|uniref:Uncharacterized protein n=1 Tax=Leptospira ryugenii TaxID=1917863 RepID=A0A2P2DXU3_9LEPT|nr:hypothetical protein [Leptospira ryugenii]GBF49454.1 hypothetical protein LPTSP4_09670 [Leptospira ryugenii]
MKSKKIGKLFLFAIVYPFFFSSLTGENEVRYPFLSQKMPSGKNEKYRIEMCFDSESIPENNIKEFISKLNVEIKNNGYSLFIEEMIYIQRDRILQPKPCIKLIGLIFKNEQD